MSCSCSLSQTGNSGMTYLEVLYTSRVMCIACIMVYNSPIQCLWYTKLPGNAVYSCTWASLQGCQITFSMPLLFTFCICFYERISLHHRSGYILKCLEMWNSKNWMLLPVFHHITPNISVAETTYKMHVSIFSSEFWPPHHTATQNSIST
jgi:hypothetical protein